MSHKPYPEVEVKCHKDHDSFYSNDQDPNLEDNFLKVFVSHDLSIISVSCNENGEFCTSYMTIEQTKALIDFLQKYVDKQSGDGK